MRAGIGFLMISLWGCTYVGGTYESNSTTQARKRTYDTKYEGTHVDAVNYWKSIQEPPQRTSSNETQPTKEGRSPPPQKRKFKANVRILVVLTMIMVYLTCLRCCLMAEPQEITIEL